MSPMRFCHICQAVLTIQPGEKTWNFAKRKTCSEECRSKLRDKNNNRKDKKGRFAFLIHHHTGQDES